MDNQKLRRKQMRKDFSPIGWTVLVYYLLMVVCVTVIAFGQSMIYKPMVQAGQMSAEQMQQLLESNGWGYLLTIVIGLLIVFVWKGKSFFTEDLMRRGRPMTAKEFFSLLVAFMGGQLLFSMINLLMEELFNLVGFSAMQAMENATANAESLSMFLYMAFGAPITEELLFRGILLRPLEKYGKRFAILVSAFLFGLMHGNVVQTPFAFVVGMILGYVAVEYNILWAIVLHMFNNLVMGDLITRVFGETVGGLLSALLIIGFGVACVVVLIVRGDDTRAYVQANKVNNEAVHCFFTCAGVICASVFLLISLVSSLTPLAS
jgi:membrane protease YdiL (CAAX protease family)